MSDVAASIRDGNPDIAEARARHNRLRMGQISDAEGRKIAAVAEDVAEISEGLLHDDLLEDRYRLPGVTRDDAVPDPVIPFGPAMRNRALETRDATIRLSARLAQIWLYLQRFDRQELSRLLDTPEAKLTGLIGALAGIMGLVAMLVI